MESHITREVLILIFCATLTRQKSFSNICLEKRLSNYQFWLKTIKDQLQPCFEIFCVSPLSNGFLAISSSKVLNTYYTISRFKFIFFCASFNEDCRFFNGSISRRFSSDHFQCHLYFHLHSKRSLIRFSLYSVVRNTLAFLLLWWFRTIFHLFLVERIAVL